MRPSQGDRSHNAARFTKDMQRITADSMEKKSVKMHNITFCQGLNVLLYSNILLGLQKKKK